MVSRTRCVVQRALLRDDELFSTPLQERNFTLPGLINNRYWQERVGSLQPYLVSDAAGGDIYYLVMDSIQEMSPGAKVQFLEKHQCSIDPLRDEDAGSAACAEILCRVTSLCMGGRSGTTLGSGAIDFHNAGCGSSLRRLDPSPSSR